MAESTEVVRHAPAQLADVAALSPDDLKKLYSIAAALALSKRFPDAQTADQAYAKVLLGRDLGMSPTQAMTGIHIVEGKPQIAAVSLAGFVRKSERYDYSIEEMNEQTCTISFTVDGTEAGRSNFTIAKARRAGLKVDDARSNWAKWPENMLFARAMSNGVKWFCPDLMGGVPIYTEGDTFEGSATEIGTGTGNGEPPGWSGVSIEQAAQIEAIVERAKALGHGGLADLATVQMSVNGQPDSVIAMWVEKAGRELDEFEGHQKAPEPVVDLDAELDAQAAAESGDDESDEGQEAMPL